MAKSKSKKTTKKEEEKMEEKVNKKLEEELKKLGKAKEDVFEPSEETPDYYKDYPRIIVCSTDPAKYVYPMMIMLENSDFVRLQAMNNYVSTVLRIMELFHWCLDKKVKRKRLVESSKGKKLVINEYILKKITPL